MPCAVHCHLVQPAGPCRVAGVGVCGILRRHTQRGNITFVHSRRRTYMPCAVHRHLVQPAGPCRVSGVGVLVCPGRHPVQLCFIRRAHQALCACCGGAVCGIAFRYSQRRNVAFSHGCRRAHMAGAVHRHLVQPAGLRCVAGVGVVVGVFGNAVQLCLVRSAHQAVCALRCHSARLCFNGTFGCRFCAGCRRLRLAYGGLAGCFRRGPVCRCGCRAGFGLPGIVFGVVRILAGSGPCSACRPAFGAYCCVPRAFCVRVCLHGTLGSLHGIGLCLPPVVAAVQPAAQNLAQRVRHTAGQSVCLCCHIIYLLLQSR